MAARKIMVIRHAEKPSEDGSVVGVSENGSPDGDQLIVRGWQRAGALVRLFSPVDGRFSNGSLESPGVVFASGVAKHSKSLRPQHTVAPLVKLLGVPFVISHPKGDEDGLVQDALSRDGVVLISWEHEAIPGIANRILGDTTSCPQKWPGDRFDLVWIFDRSSEGGDWRFNQVPQLLLPGDLAETIPIAANQS